MTPRRFATTRWSLILAAADPQSLDARGALASLCEIYWTPVYAFIRRAGHSPEDAQDLTQAFFVRVLEKSTFQQARQERGRFRSYLLESVRNFLANEWDRNQTLKRGGGLRHLSLEFDDGERHYQREPVDILTPEVIYDRQWASAAIEDAQQRLAHWYDGAGRLEAFERLKPLLHGDDDVSYRSIASAAGVSEGSLRVAVHRMRQQYAKCLRDTIAETVETEADIEAELRHLLAVIGR